ncbi:hypothetical protein SCA6_013547 [Theobroma cacao]
MSIKHTIICARDLRFKDDQLELIGAKAANHLKVLFALLVQLIGDRKCLDVLGFCGKWKKVPTLELRTGPPHSTVGEWTKVE